MMHAIHEEMNGVFCKHIDIDTTLSGSFLIEEIQSMDKFEREVIYREGNRFVSKLKRASENKILPSFTLEENGTYVITGGLGGIAIILAEELIKRANIGLLLIGRKPLENIEQDKRHDYDRLRQISDHVRYINVDLINYVSLKEKIGKKNIKGIFHLAADFTTMPINDFSEEIFKEQIQVKVKGSYNLYSLAKEMKISHLINFSSVNGYFGGVGVIAYAAANRFQESLVYYSDKDNNTKVWNMSWSMWENIGLSRKIKFPELAERRGFDIINVTDAMEVIQKILKQGNPNTFVGLNEENFHMHPYLSLKADVVEELDVLIDENHLKEDIVRDIKDEFGTPIPVSDIVLDKATISESDNIQENRANTQDDIKSFIISIFKEVLNIDSISEEDSFFDLGGNSLILPQIYSKIEETFPCDLTIVDLFQHTSAHELSILIGNKLETFRR